MKKYYVYELVNQEGKVEYVGCSYRPKERFYQHTKVPPQPGMGKFYRRTDLTLNLVESFNDKKDALNFEGKHKIDNGFEWTEKTSLQKLGKILGKKYGKFNAKENAIKSQGHSINVYDYNTNKFINSFRSLGEAARELNIHKQGIYPCLKGKYKQYKGYTFRYA